MVSKASWSVVPRDCCWSWLIRDIRKNTCNAIFLYMQFEKCCYQISLMRRRKNIFSYLRWLMKKDKLPYFVEAMWSIYVPGTCNLLIIANNFKTTNCELTCGPWFWQGICNSSAQTVGREWGASCCILIWWLDSWEQPFVALCLLNPFLGWILIWSD